MQCGLPRGRRVRRHRVRGACWRGRIARLANVDARRPAGAVISIDGIVRWMRAGHGRDDAFTQRGAVRRDADALCASRGGSAVCRCRASGNSGNGRRTTRTRRHTALARKYDRTSTRPGDCNRKELHI
ncbi:hypothetical protein DIE22_16490 [Burkholderia sp. Bp9142]|nr:hypothetical protein DIE22_16490 [Burkholderia sp. Bp9142]RQR52999.1 hypothetical protein DIE21_10520 [Burkholderia sp. Bp9140]